MKNKAFKLMLSVIAVFSLVACSKNESGTNPSVDDKTPTSDVKTSETKSQEKEYVYSDIPDDFMSRIDWVENEAKEIPENVTFPYETGDSLGLFRQLNPEKWTEGFPRTLMVVLTVKDCKRCGEYEELIVQKAQEELLLLDDTIGKNKAILTRHELPNDQAKSDEELHTIADRLGIDVAVFDESRPVIFYFSYLKENGTNQFKWKNTFKEIPREDGSGISDSVGEKYLEKMSEAYNQTF